MHHCSNNYLSLVLVFAVLGVLMVLMMFAINFTIIDGTIDGLMFYVNIASITITVYFISSLMYSFPLLILTWEFRHVFTMGC